MSKEVRLGLFIVVTLAILFAGVFLIGNTETLFKSTYRVKAEFQNVAGLNDGADVRVGGIHEGTVRKIDLPKRPDGKVTVVMDLQSATRVVQAGLLCVSAGIGEHGAVDGSVGPGPQRALVVPLIPAARLLAHQVVRSVRLQGQWCGEIRIDKLACCATAHGNHSRAARKTANS